MMQRERAADDASGSADPRDGAGVAGLPTWGEYYDFDLGWTEHLGNVLYHLPFLNEIRRARPRNVLEVGTGTGSLSTFVSYFVRNTVSVDISSDVLARAQRNSRRLRGRATFRMDDAFTLSSCASASFDVAMSQGFFEHFSDKDIVRLLQQQVRVADRVILSVPNAAYGVRDRGDERLMPGEAWDALLRAAGCRIERSHDYRPVCRGSIPGRRVRIGPVMYLAVASRA